MHIARAGPKPATGRSALRSMTPHPIFAAYGFIVLAAMVLNALGASMQSPALWPLALAVPAAGLYARTADRWRLPPATAHVRRAIAAHPDPRYRLRVICTPRQAQYLAELPGDIFEPRIFVVPFTIPQSRAAQIAFAVPPIAAAFVVFTLGFQWLTLRYGPFSSFFFMGGLYLAALPACLAWPAYLRVVPGRLDVMHYPFLGRGKPRTRSFDLTTAGVLIDLRRRRLTIEEPGHPPAHINSAAIFAAERLAKAVLEAARSTHRAPPLPEDALLG